MARLPRLKVQEAVGWYHLWSRVAGWLDWLPFEEDPIVREKLLQTIRSYVSAYFCEAAGFCLMGNHYHLVVRFEEFREVSSEELYRRAQQIYSRPERVLRTRRQWRRFHRRLFDVSELMRNIQQSYTKWYNRRNARRGSFWAERFGSSLLADSEAVMEALLYVELNPVRAGLVEVPEQWRWSSACLRVLREDSWLLPLEQLQWQYADYRSLLYHRGAVVSKLGSGVIRQDLLRDERTRGFRRPGAYAKRLRFFTRGLVLGGRLQVEDWIRDLRRKGYYLRRKHPIPQLVDHATFYTLREQRNSSLRT